MVGCLARCILGRVRGAEAGEAEATGMNVFAEPIDSTSLSVREDDHTGLWQYYGSITCDTEAASLAAIARPLQHFG